MSVIRGTLRRILRRKHRAERIAAIRDRANNLKERIRNWRKHHWENRAATKRERKEKRNLKRWEYKRSLLAQAALDLSRFIQVHGDLPEQEIERIRQELQARLHIAQGFVWSPICDAICATTAAIAGWLTFNIAEHAGVDMDLPGNSVIVIIAIIVVVISVLFGMLAVLATYAKHARLRYLAEYYVLNLKYPSKTKIKTIEFSECGATIEHIKVLLREEGCWVDSRDYLKQVIKGRAS